MNRQLAVVIAVAAIASQDHAHSYAFLPPDLGSAARSAHSVPRSTAIEATFAEYDETTASDDDDPQSPLAAGSYTLKRRNPYDVHVYHDGTTERREKAMDLREKMMQEFQWMRFYPPKDRLVGPHPAPMWEADFGAYENRRELSNVKDFIGREGGNLSVLIHPHSTDGDYADHTVNAWWAGEVLRLRIQGWDRS